MPPKRVKNPNRVRTSLRNARVFGLSFPIVRHVSRAQLRELHRALSSESRP